MYKEENFKKYEKQLWELGKSQLTFSKNLIFQVKQMIKLKMLFTLLPCIQQTLFAKKNIDSEAVIGPHVEGVKYICIDKLVYDVLNNECVIFSFQIKNDWSFEDVMDNLGCTVFAFDPSVDFPSRRGRNITFEKLGVAAKKDQAKLMDTLGNILKKYHHERTKISYLKMDIEGSELTGLPQWLSDGALKNVQQVAAEVHLRGTETTIKFLRTMQRLYFEGDYRLISYEPNGCWHNIADKEKFYYLSEIVLKKVNQEHKVMEKNCEILGL